MDTQAARAYILAKLKADLPPGRTYHSLGHTLDVYASVIEIGEQEGVDEEGFALLKMAALYHDAGFTEQDQDHEAVGCRIVRDKLPEFGFTKEQIEHVCRMIMSTKIPQSPEDHLSSILCDADLDYLGRSDFQLIGNTLFAEFQTYGVLSTEREWNELQVRFLEKHRYFTVTNKTLREPLKQQHLLELKAWLATH